MPRRYFPPTLRSTSADGVAYPSGPHHFFNSSGSVQARKTLFRGALKIRRRLSVISVPGVELAIAFLSLWVNLSNVWPGRQIAFPRSVGSVQSIPRQPSWVLE